MNAVVGSATVDILTPPWWVPRVADAATLHIESSIARSLLGPSEPSGTEADAIRKGARAQESPARFMPSSI